MISFWNLFSKPKEEKQVFADNEVVALLDPKRLENFSDKGKKICEVVQDSGFYKPIDVDSKALVSKVIGMRFKRTSKHPGETKFNNQEISFKEADYILEISKEGKVNYQVMVKGNYYPIKFHAMDPDVKFFHDKYIHPVLEEKELNQRVMRI